jgi:hypothetical protein
LPGVFSIIDGVPFQTRGDAASYCGGKYKMKVWKFTVITDLQGCPVYWAGPFSEAETDAHQYKCLADFKHFTGEMIAADKGYIGRNHCMCALKTNMVDYKAHPHEYDLFEKQLGFIRTRVEHLFARLKQWKILVHNNMSRTTFGRAVHLILLIHFVADSGKGKFRYDDVNDDRPIGAPLHSFTDLRAQGRLGNVCPCKMSDPAWKAGTYEQIKALKDHINKFAEFMPESGKKESKGAKK